MSWHQLTAEETLEKFDSTHEGLSDSSARERLEKYGRNELQEKKRKPAWLLFLLQFKDVMILILAVAAGVSLLIGDLKDAVVIAVIVVLNAVIGFVQEYRAAKAMEALKKMSMPTATVRREGKSQEISAAELVPGDIVFLKAGDMAPADIRLLSVHSLKIEEASLTGESHDVEKHTEKLEEEKLPLGDRANMAYKNTLVTYGRGRGVVIATGMETEIGNIAKMLGEEEALTPLQKRLASFGKKLSLIVLGICVVVYAAGVLRGEDPVEMLLTAISLAVAAIPEALPAVVTIALALGARRMVKKNALIRKLPAVETLGSVTFICTDKTGTLTQNKMTVTEIWASESAAGELSLSPDEVLVRCMALNHDVKENEEGGLTGDSTEIALVEFARNHEAYASLNLKERKRVQEIPFDSERKMMTTIHKFGEQYLVVTKGALEAIQNVCENFDKKAVGKSEEMAGQGLRVLAFAWRLIKNLPENPDSNDIEKSMRFCGLAGMMDPPRDEAAQAIGDCISAGIVPVMITGDHPVTAKSIANQIGILKNENDKVISGKELEEMPQEEFEKEIEHIKVYARVSPEQKLQIVKTLQKKNHFVAMTGDGVNDAPALKRANIGVAMGITGTDVSKEAAHMILLDDNFATIVKAVREGRRIFDNIRKFIRYTMTSNSGEIWTIFLAPLFGLPIPLLPIHILWINLVTDGLPGLALAGEPAEKNVMKRPPRPPKESIFAKGLGIHIVWVGLLMGGICFATQLWAIGHNDPKWQTYVFTILCFSQMGHVLAIRSEEFFLFRQGIFSNLPLIGAVLLTFALQLAIIYIPALQDIFRTQPLSWQELGICILISSVVFHAVEVEKLVRGWRRKKPSDED